MGNIFLASDHHFNDINALNYRDRPFDSLDEMNHFMVDNWNKYIKSDDTVYHLGDFAVKDEDLSKFSSMLNGKILLLMGNHDCKRDYSLLNSCFDTVYNDPFELEFDKKYDIYNEGNKIWLCHYPVQRNVDLYTATGHIHDLWKISKNMVNIGVDAWHFRPVSLEKVIECRHSENLGRWDANVYPDADIAWKWAVSNKIEREKSGNEPTLDIIAKELYESKNKYYNQPLT